MPHLGEIIEGNKYKNSGLHIEFARDTPKSTVCTQTLTSHDVECFMDALNEDYYYQLYLDHLPILGKLGEISSSSIYTHKELTISYNHDRIIHVSLKNGNLKSLKTGQRLDFSYSVRWVPTTETFETRFDRYLDDDFFEHQIHWFAIFNSFMMVVFLSGVVMLILVRTLKSDYAKYVVLMFNHCSFHFLLIHFTYFTL
jgi:transmembrane 9 superfamily member 3